ncbi:hypothetical protein [Nonomuraea sp. NPDC049625]
MRALTVWWVLVIEIVCHSRDLGQDPEHLLSAMQSLANQIAASIA